MSEQTEVPSVDFDDLPAAPLPLPSTALLMAIGAHITRGYSYSHDGKGHAHMATADK